MKNLSTVIVDDDSMILMLHEHILRKAKMIINKSLLTAYDGQEALKPLKENDNTDTTFLIFLDINMPVMDGWEFMEALEASNMRSAVFVCIVTSSIDLYDKQKVEKYSRILSYVEKPLNLKNLEKLRSKSELNQFFA